MEIIPRITNKLLSKIDNIEELCIKWKNNPKEQYYLELNSLNGIKVNQFCKTCNKPLTIRQLQKNRLFCQNACYDRKNPDTIKKMKNSHFNKFGQWAQQNKDVYNKSEISLLKGFGHKRPAGNSKVKQKIDFTRRTTVNNHINYEIFDNFPDIQYITKEEFIYYLNKINCSEDYFRKFLIKRNISIEAQPSSLLEIEILNFIDEINKNYVLHDRSVLDGKEIDIYFPELKIGIEVNGDYWHQIIEKEELYHYNKSLLAANHNIRLIHIWEHEWKNNSCSIKNIIKRYLEGELPDIGIYNGNLPRDYFQEIDFPNYILDKPLLEIKGRNHSVFKQGYLKNPELQQGFIL